MVVIELLDEEVRSVIEAFDLAESHSYNYGLSLNMVEQNAFNKFKNAYNESKCEDSLINRLQDRVTILEGKLRDMNKSRDKSIYHFQTILNLLYNADYDKIEKELKKV